MNDNENYYWNVWHIDLKRWTNSGQMQDNPKQLEYNEAKKLCDRLNLGYSAPIFILKKLSRKSINVLPNLEGDDAITIINDYTCPSCFNEKCSTTESSCWRCGAKFNQKK